MARIQRNYTKKDHHDPDKHDGVIIHLEPDILKCKVKWALGRITKPVEVGNLISGSSAFSKSSMNNWKFMVHGLLKPGLENFENYFDSE